jgi:hypothetical protein
VQTEEELCMPRGEGADGVGVPHLIEERPSHDSSNYDTLRSRAQPIHWRIGGLPLVPFQLFAPKR